MTARRIAILKPVPCEVCGGRKRVLIGSPDDANTTEVPCLACQWRIPILMVEVMS